MDVDFPSVHEKVQTRARDQALRALSHEGTPEKVGRFYDPESNFAGSTFTQLRPLDPDAVTATDLLATGTLSVTIPPRAVRRILEDEDTKRELSRLMSALPPVKLESTTVADFAPMCEFYDLVKSSLAQAGTASSNPWVTASKITARKRPTFTQLETASCASTSAFSTSTIEHGTGTSFVSFCVTRRFKVGCPSSRIERGRHIEG